ncbi:pathogen and circadian controlled 1 [Striga asiatica]|uniref:Pathogen and circadian controlled 1 n=1 Tax=Striga asiatica TaxID=4170 RepID=A0A5A7RHD9_STRAF|nr:pathogen and circadian controlled 1 [Striga asiatica]
MEREGEGEEAEEEDGGGHGGRRWNRKNKISKSSRRPEISNPIRDQLLGDHPCRVRRVSAGVEVDLDGVPHAGVGFPTSSFSLLLRRLLFFIVRVLRGFERRP